MASCCSGSATPPHEYAHDRNVEEPPLSRYLLDAVFQSEKLGTNLRIAGDSQMTVPVSRCHIWGIYGRRPVILGAVESNALVSGEHGIFWAAKTVAAVGRTVGCYDA